MAAAAEKHQHLQTQAAAERQHQVQVSNATLRDPKPGQRRELALSLLLDAAAHSLMGGQETVTAPRPFMQAMSPKKATLTLDGDGVRSKLAALARAARLPGVSCGT